MKTSNFAVGQEWVVLVYGEEVRVEIIDTNGIIKTRITWSQDTSRRPIGEKWDFHDASDFVRQVHVAESITAESITAESITEAQYNYLLPVLRAKLLCRRNEGSSEYFFIGTGDEIADMRRRLVGMDHIWGAEAYLS